MNLLLKNKVNTIDFLRGIILVLLAINHIKSYFLLDSVTNNYLDLSILDSIIIFFKEFFLNALIFLFCTSPLILNIKIREKHISKQLVLSGFFLIFVELILFYVLRGVNIPSEHLNFNAIRVIGFIFLALSIVAFLPKNLILLFGIVLLFGQNILENLFIQNQKLILFLNNNSISSELIYKKSSGTLQFDFPIISWFSALILTIYFSKIYRGKNNNYKTKSYLFYLGLSSITLFYLVNCSKFYLEHFNLFEQNSFIVSVINFFKLTYYSNSATSLFIIFGPILLLLSFRKERIVKLYSKQFLFIKAPLIMYGIHVFIIHGMSNLILLISGSIESPISYSILSINNENYTLSLFMLYLLWVVTLFLLYPFYLKYNRKKTMIFNYSIIKSI